MPRSSPQLAGSPGVPAAGGTRRAIGTGAAVGHALRCPARGAAGRARGAPVCLAARATSAPRPTSASACSTRQRDGGMACASRPRCATWAWRDRGARRASGGVGPSAVARVAPPEPRWSRRTPRSARTTRRRCRTPTSVSRPRPTSVPGLAGDHRSAHRGLQTAGYLLRELDERSCGRLRGRASPAGPAADRPSTNLGRDQRPARPPVWRPRAGQRRR